MGSFLGELGSTKQLILDQNLEEFFPLKQKFEQQKPGFPKEEQ